MPVTRCKFVDAARAMKIYALTKKRPSMTMIIGVSSRGGYSLAQCTVGNPKPFMQPTRFTTNATIFIMLCKPLQKFHFFNLLELKPFWPQFGSSFLGNNSIDGCQKMVLNQAMRRCYSMKNGLLTPLMLF